MLAFARVFGDIAVTATVEKAHCASRRRLVVSHLQKRVGDKEGDYDREHMIREMQALVDRRVVPLLEAPK